MLLFYTKVPKMKILKTIKELNDYRDSLTCSIGFVPTMGALHNGHVSLIKRSTKENEKTIISIFVNPKQFSQNEDFSKYPIKQNADLKICELANVDAVFIPCIENIYFKNEPILLAPAMYSSILEGHQRPKHFDGVLSIVLKLINLTRPDNTYFGKKDTQQLFLVQNMVKTLFLKTNIVPCETLRDKDGLALSSRNIYLNEKQKKDAQSVPNALKFALSEVAKGNLHVEDITKKMRDILKNLHIDYIVITNRELKQIKIVELKNSFILVAVRVGTTRLLDNVWV